MAMDQAENQVALNDNLYFFRSFKQSETRCLIFGHSGLVSGAGLYQIPDWLTFTFFVGQHGQPIVTNPERAIKGGPQGQSQTITAGNPIYDYVVGKGVGIHWAHTQWYQKINYKDGSFIDYEGICSLMQYLSNTRSMWTPHVVIVRKRKPYILPLSTIIEAIHAHDSTITKIYFAGCRGDHRPPPERELVSIP